ncbi:MAG: hypothetical protein HND47_15285 [Chloroflexi bacterium]|nr:hypothetical protein [Chloroflexota bacterium]
MSDFTVKDLNFSRCRRWILDANTKRDVDPVYSFIASWISFNHFYGTYASSNRVKFREWSRNNMNGSSGDKAQLLYLISRNEFTDFFNNFKTEQKELFEIKVRLPVINLLNEQGVPDGIEGEYSLEDLQAEQIFLVIYQVRNNLFHGNKDPFTNERDRRLSRVGSWFMLIFLSALLSHTYGEELDALDDEQQQEIKNVAHIAKRSLEKEQPASSIDES